MRVQPASSSAAAQALLAGFALLTLALDAFHGNLNFMPHLCKKFSRTMQLLAHWAS